MRIAFAALLVVASFAGCIGVPPLTPDVPSDAPHVGGYGSDERTIRVTDLNGTPVPDAAIVVYWVSAISGATSKDRAAHYARLWQAQVNVTKEDQQSTTLQWVGLRADGAGAAKVRLPHQYGALVAASAPGYSDGAAFIGYVYAGNLSDVQVKLFPASIHWAWDATMSNGCNLQALSFGERGNEVQAHVTDVRVRITWDNGPTTGIHDVQPELVTFQPALLVQGEPSCDAPATSSGSHAGLGPQAEVAKWGPETLKPAEVAIYLPGIYVGAAERPLAPSIAAPGSASFHVDAVAYLNFTAYARSMGAITCRFCKVVPSSGDSGDDPAGLRGEPTTGHASPLPALALVAFALLGASAVARRRQR